MIQANNSAVKVKNIALPVNKLDSADGLNLMSVPPITTAISSTFCTGWPHNPLFDLCGKGLPCHSKLKLQRKASGHLPVQNSELPLSPILADRQFFFSGHSPTRSSHGLTTVRRECLPLLDLNICPGPEAAKGMAGKSKPCIAKTGTEETHDFLSAKQTLVAPGYTCIKGILSAVSCARFMQCSNSQGYNI